MFSRFKVFTLALSLVSVLLLACQMLAQSVPPPSALPPNLFVDTQKSALIHHGVVSIHFIDGNFVIQLDGYVWDPDTQQWVPDTEGELESPLAPFDPTLDFIHGKPATNRIPDTIFFPVPGGTASWGPHVDGQHPNNSTYPGHEGVDIMAPRGTPVVSPVDGQVVRIERVSVDGVSWGKLVVIKDSCGNYWFLAHLDSIDAGLKVGDTISAGAQIATVGNTGSAAGGPTHLHVGINPNGYQSPASETSGNRFDRWYYPWYFLGQFGGSHK